MLVSSFDWQEKEESASCDYYGNVWVTEKLFIEAREWRIETTVIIFRFPCLLAFSQSV